MFLDEGGKECIEEKSTGLPNYVFDYASRLVLHRRPVGGRNRRPKNLSHHQAGRALTKQRKTDVSDAVSLRLCVL